MAMQQAPHLDLFHGSLWSPTAEGRGLRRLWIFLPIFLLSLAIGVTIVYSRAPQYRATATVLTVKPKPIDAPSAAADPEHVQIQERVLLGDAIMSQLWGQLAGQGPAVPEDVDALARMLSVEPITGTNLVELRAEGGEPELLQQVVNLWAEAYQAVNAQQIASLANETEDELRDEQAQLALKIDGARAEVKTFRERYDIVSLEREENSALSALKGLNNSVNDARERLVEAQAQLTAIQAAIANGDTVAPREQKADLARMKQQMLGAKDRLEQLRSKYTNRYIELSPAFRDLPESVGIMERDYERAAYIARITALDDAKREVVAARETIAELERQQQEQQRKVQGFTERFKEFATMEEDQKRLEELQAENAARLAQIQVRNLDKYPPIRVVEEAALPKDPISPNYERDLAIAAAAALLTALFLTWLVDYLRGHPKAETMPYLGLRVGTAGSAQRLEPGGMMDVLEAQEPEAPTELLSHKAVPSPSTPVVPATRELSVSEVGALLEVADTLTLGYAVLLLAGISPKEIKRLSAHSFDRTNARVHVLGTAPREVQLAPEAWEALEPLVDALEHGLKAPSPARLDEWIEGTAAKARLDPPGRFTAAALRLSYAMFLARQGVGREALAQRLGTLDEEIQNLLTTLSMRVPGPLPSQVDWVYPIPETA